MKKLYVKIDGIHCDNCINKITKNLIKIKNVENVKIIRNIAHIEYKGKLNKEEIIKTITDLDYITNEEYISDNLNDIDTKIKLYEFILIVICILGFAFLLKLIFKVNIFNIIPKIDSNITYLMLIVTGLFTSIHCISMCGAINLIAITGSNNKNKFINPLLYNLGRVISYTLIGGLVGLIGSVFKLNDTLNGIIIILSSIIMLLMGLNMLGITKIRLPKFIRFNVKFKNKSAFFIGLANGLMPCGPLQAMQLYALSTGNMLKGALSLFLFGIGTIPLMLSVGVIFNILKGKKKILLNKIASVLIVLLSIVMLNRGLLALGFNLDNFKSSNNEYSDYHKSTIVNDYQVISFDLSYNSYDDIILQKGIPARIIINANEKYLTGCNYQILMNDFNIEKNLEVGLNMIEFTPEEVGDYFYTCGMRMIKNKIKVIDNIEYFKGDE